MESKTAFVMTGGGSLGAVHVGMLRALTAAGVAADLVVGASAGAINAVGYAAGPDRTAAVTALEQLWEGVRRKDLARWRPGLLFRLVSTRRNHLFSLDRVERRLRGIAPVENLEDCAIPCGVVATDVAYGVEVVLREGAALEAVLAASAVPGIWRPRRVGGRLLMDGGVGSHAPVSEAVRMGATRVVLLPVGYSCKLGTEPESPLEMMIQGLLISQVRQLTAELDAYGTRIPIRVVPPPCPIDVSPVDFGQSGRLITEAYEAARAWLEADGLESAELPDSLRRARPPLL